ncbi:AP2 domain transcription factor AP2IX-3 [Toxoplasma gondii RUB]|uniref:AP2 domain transcription factor AP2IX-3 n=1 Tax=Toxoplasma gondii RUB TaxID=935652 RepID=A0A086LNK6_TOXGO|nr:AP2 domain transcription factor AP2IX-3 [Toxoplasma gondii RUB]
MILPSSPSLSPCSSALPPAPSLPSTCQGPPMHLWRVPEQLWTGDGRRVQDSIVLDESFCREVASVSDQSLLGRRCLENEESEASDASLAPNHSSAVSAFPRPSLALSPSHVTQRVAFAADWEVTEGCGDAVRGGRNGGDGREEEKPERRKRERDDDEQRGNRVEEGNDEKVSDPSENGGTRGSRESVNAVPHSPSHSASRSPFACSLPSLPGSGLNREDQERILLAMGGRRLSPRQLSSVGKDGDPSTSSACSNYELPLESAPSALTRSSSGYVDSSSGYVACASGVDGQEPPHHVSSVASSSNPAFCHYARPAADRTQDDQPSPQQAPSLYGAYVDAPSPLSFSSVPFPLLSTRDLPSRHVSLSASPYSPSLFPLSQSPSFSPLFHHSLSSTDSPAHASEKDTSPDDGSEAAGSIPGPSNALAACLSPDFSTQGPSAVLPLPSSESSPSGHLQAPGLSPPADDSGEQAACPQNREARFSSSSSSAPLLPHPLSGSAVSAKCLLPGSSPPPLPPAASHPPQAEGPSAEDNTSTSLVSSANTAFPVPPLDAPPSQGFRLKDTLSGSLLPPPGAASSSSVEQSSSPELPNADPPSLSRGPSVFVDSGEAGSHALPPVASEPPRSLVESVHVRNEDTGNLFAGYYPASVLRGAEGLPPSAGVRTAAGLFFDSEGTDGRLMLEQLDLLRSGASKDLYKRERTRVVDELIRQAVTYPKVSGIYFDKHQLRWSVGWAQHGRRVAKYFPVKIFGLAEGYRLAVHFKHAMRAAAVAGSAGVAPSGPAPSPLPLSVAGFPSLPPPSALSSPVPMCPLSQHPTDFSGCLGAQLAMSPLVSLAGVPPPRHPSVGTGPQSGFPPFLDNMHNPISVAPSQDSTQASAGGSAELRSAGENRAATDSVPGSASSHREGPFRLVSDSGALPGSSGAPGEPQSLFPLAPAALRTLRNGFAFPPLQSLSHDSPQFPCHPVPASPFPVSLPSALPPGEGVQSFAREGDARGEGPQPTASGPQVGEALGPHLISGPDEARRGEAGVHAACQEALAAEQTLRQGRKDRNEGGLTACEATPLPEVSLEQSECGSPRGTGEETGDSEGLCVGAVREGKRGEEGESGEEASKPSRPTDTGGFYSDLPAAGEREDTRKAFLSEQKGLGDGPSQHSSTLAKREEDDKSRLGSLSSSHDLASCISRVLFVKTQPEEGQNEVSMETRARAFPDEKARSEGARGSHCLVAGCRKRAAEFPDTAEARERTKSEAFFWAKEREEGAQGDARSSPESPSVTNHSSLPAASQWPVGNRVKGLDCGAADGRNENLPRAWEDASDPLSFCTSFQSCSSPSRAQGQSCDGMHPSPGEERGKRRPACGSETAAEDRESDPRCVRQETLGVPFTLRGRRSKRLRVSSATCHLGEAGEPRLQSLAEGGEQTGDKERGGSIECSSSGKEAMAGEESEEQSRQGDKAGSASGRLCLHLYAHASASAPLPSRSPSSSSVSPHPGGSCLFATGASPAFLGATGGSGASRVIPSSSPSAPSSSGLSAESSGVSSTQLETEARKSEAPVQAASLHAGPLGFSGDGENAARHLDERDGQFTCFLAARDRITAPAWLGTPCQVHLASASPSSPHHLSMQHSSLPSSAFGGCPAASPSAPCPANASPPVSVPSASLCPEAQLQNANGLLYAACPSSVQGSPGTTTSPCVYSLSERSRAGLPPSSAFRCRGTLFTQTFPPHSQITCPAGSGSEDSPYSGSTSSSLSSSFSSTSSSSPPVSTSASLYSPPSPSGVPSLLPASLVQSSPPLCRLPPSSSLPSGSFPPSSLSSSSLPPSSLPSSSACPSPLPSPGLASGSLSSLLPSSSQLASSPPRCVPLDVSAAPVGDRLAVGGNTSGPAEGPSGTPALGVLPHTTGIHFDKHSLRWKATWYDTTGQRKAKYFPVGKYGYDQARRLAIQARQANHVPRSSRFAVAHAQQQAQLQQQLLPHALMSPSRLYPCSLSSSFSLFHASLLGNQPAARPSLVPQAFPASPSPSQSSPSTCVPYYSGPLPSLSPAPPPQAASASPSSAYGPYPSYSYCPPSASPATCSPPLSSLSADSFLHLRCQANDGGTRSSLADASVGGHRSAVGWRTRAEERRDEEGRGNAGEKEDRNEVGDKERDAGDSDREMKKEEGQLEREGDTWFIRDEERETETERLRGEHAARNEAEARHEDHVLPASSVPASSEHRAFCHDRERGEQTGAGDNACNSTASQCECLEGLEAEGEEETEDIEERQIQEIGSADMSGGRLQSRNGEDPEKSKEEDAPSQGGEAYESAETTASGEQEEGRQVFPPEEKGERREEEDQAEGEKEDNDEGENEGGRTRPEGDEDAGKMLSSSAPEDDDDTVLDEDMFDDEADKRLSQEPSRVLIRHASRLERVPGIWFDKKQLRWACTFTDSSVGKRRAEYYPIRHFGFFGARRLAVHARRRMERLRQEQQYFQQQMVMAQRASLPFLSPHSPYMASPYGYASAPSALLPPSGSSASFLPPSISPPFHLLSCSDSAHNVPVGLSPKAPSASALSPPFLPSTSSPTFFHCSGAKSSPSTSCTPSPASALSFSVSPASLPVSHSSTAPGLTFLHQQDGARTQGPAEQLLSSRLHYSLSSASPEAAAPSLSTQPRAHVQSPRPQTGSPPVSTGSEDRVKHGREREDDETVLSPHQHSDVVQALRCQAQQHGSLSSAAFSSSSPSATEAEKPAGVSEKQTGPEAPFDNLERSPQTSPQIPFSSNCHPSKHHGGVRMWNARDEESRSEGSDGGDRRGQEEGGAVEGRLRALGNEEGPSKSSGFKGESESTTEPKESADRIRLRRRAGALNETAEGQDEKLVPTALTAREGEGEKAPCRRDIVCMARHFGNEVGSPSFLPQAGTVSGTEQGEGNKSTGEREHREATETTRRQTFWPLPPEAVHLRLPSKAPNAEAAVPRQSEREAGLASFESATRRQDGQQVASPPSPGELPPSWKGSPEIPVPYGVACGSASSPECENKTGEPLLTLERQAVRFLLLDLKNKCLTNLAPLLLPDVFRRHSIHLVNHIRRVENAVSCEGLESFLLLFADCIKTMSLPSQLGVTEQAHMIGLVAALGDELDAQGV